MNYAKRGLLGLAGLLLAGSAAVSAQADDLTASVAGEMGYAYDLYKHFHANPELSFQEKNTSARLAKEWRAAGYEVTENVGGYGVVGIMENGSGPTLMIRADMDGLPVAEQTGLPYASTVKATEMDGQEVSVMHACGHDTHISAQAGTARLLAANKDRWQGRLVLIAQPAEERGAGAEAMLEDGLYERFGVPDYVIGFHDGADLLAGDIGYIPHYAMANVDSVDITVRGIGAHGSAPETGKDPVYLASQIVIALQGIVSREIGAQEPVVVTVGSIHGGTKHNIISDRVHLQLTVRSYTDEARDYTLAAIKRIAEGQARSYGLPEELMPVVVSGEEFTPALYNDPALTERIVGLFKAHFGEDRVHEKKPVMGGEDFARYGRTKEDVPIMMFYVGGVDADTWAKAQAGEVSLPSLHSPFWAPDAKGTLQSAMEAFLLATYELLPPSGN